MQGNPTYRLVVRRGPQPNQVYELTGDVTNIGRDITNDIVINDREVSRHHLRFMRGADGYTIEDLGSTNGTFVNGKRVTGATPLNNGDMIGLGETVTLGFEVKRPGQADAGGDSPAQPQQTAPSQDAPKQEEPQPQPRQPSPSSQQQSSSSGQQAQNPYQESSSSQGQQGQQRQPQQEQPRQQPAYQQRESYQPQYQQAQSYESGDEQQGYYATEGGGDYGPPPPGYDYDPYSMGADEGSNTMRWVLFGCLGLLLFCCCITIISIVIIDTFVLYCDIPILRDVLEAVGLLRC